ncbi:glycoside hydrolase family 28 protein [Sporanaerobium hydrogeniformans]|uniref:glycoside hydrolase family 28 protein n=1 Tax=Sporanaerobium hydrogeniformans TaxID=3072179 RepID=UPI0026D9D852|nr:glycoside hydrolase family 28 protein [Sporanaerobium hydrogeniformans]
MTISGLRPHTLYTIRLTSETEHKEWVQQIETTYETAVLNVRDFGAIGDGEHLDTQAIQAAIAAAPLGARIVLPPGVYKSTPIFLKSHITLELEEGAILLGDTRREAYSILPGVVEKEKEDYYLGFWEGEPVACYASLVTGICIQDVKIIGKGIIDGNAQNSDWWVDAKVKRGAWRPRTIYLVDCTAVTIEGITIQNSPSWTIHPIRCKDMQFINLSLINPKDSPNTDGINPESSSDIEIVGVRFSLGDDCVAIKSGKYTLPPERRLASKKITIRNCFMEFGHGAVVIGSEMSGGVKQVKVERCLFKNTDRGIRIKTRRGRGSTAIIDDIVVKNIKMDGVLTPFTINAFYFCDSDGKTEYVWSKEKLPRDERTPVIGKLSFENIECINVQVCAGFIYGLPEEKIQSLTFKNISVTFKEDAVPDYPEMLSFQEKIARTGFVFRNIIKLSLEQVSVAKQLGNPFLVEEVETYNYK